jgi:hypothetical protein
MMPLFVLTFIDFAMMCGIVLIWILAYRMGKRVGHREAYQFRLNAAVEKYLEDTGHEL